jgi:hypothetical protein
VNVRKNTMISNPAKPIKGSGTTPKASNQAKPIKNAVATSGTKSVGVTAARNSGSCPC